MPNRVRVEGDLFHGRVPDGATYVGRATPGLAMSFFRNPFKVGASLDDSYGGGLVRDVQHAVELFEAYVRRQGDLYREAAVRELAGRDIACWCPLPESGEPDWCHGSVLLALANPVEEVSFA